MPKINDSPLFVHGQGFSRWVQTSEEWERLFRYQWSCYRHAPSRMVRREYRHLCRSCLARIRWNRVQIAKFGGRDE